jgi:membrane protease YdiL (CAAX protease family)
MVRLVLLALEFSVVFVGFPLLIYFRALPNYPIPYLLATALAGYVVLRVDPSFHFGRPTWSMLRPYLGPLLLRDALFLVLLAIAVWLFRPDLLFSLLKRSPILWVAVMLLYPLLSVYPQELLYRAYFFHRYQPLFGSGWGMLLASALAFGFVHIIFGNWLAVALCVMGGLLFSLTYQSSESLVLTCLDHAIFGNFIFTIGLGRFFYHGTRF